MCLLCNYKLCAPIIIGMSSVFVLFFLRQTNKSTNMSETLEEKLKKIADKLCTPKNEILYNVTLEEVNSYLQESARQGYELCLKEYEKNIRWIPVEEKLPNNTKFVLCRCDFNGRVDYIISKYYKSGWQINVFYSKAVKVTHWRSFL